MLQAMLGFMLVCKVADNLILTPSPLPQPKEQPLKNCKGSGRPCDVCPQEVRLIEKQAEISICVWSAIALPNKSTSSMSSVAAVFPSSGHL